MQNIGVDRSNQSLYNPTDNVQCLSECFGDIPRSLHESIHHVNNSCLQYVCTFQENQIQKCAIDGVSSFKPKKLNRFISPVIVTCSTSFQAMACASTLSKPQW